MSPVGGSHLSEGCSCLIGRDNVVNLCLLQTAKDPSRGSRTDRFETWWNSFEQVGQKFSLFSVV